MSNTMAENLFVKAEEATRIITVATSYKSPVVGILTAVPVGFPDMVIYLYFLVMYGAPFDVIIGYHVIEELG